MLEHDWRSGRFFSPSYLKEAPVLVARARSEFRQLPENRYRNIGPAATELKCFSQNHSGHKKRPTSTRYNSVRTDDVHHEIALC